MYGVNQAFCLNLVAVYTIFNTNPWFNASIEVVMYTSCYVSKLLTVKSL